MLVLLLATHVLRWVYFFRLPKLITHIISISLTIARRDRQATLFAQLVTSAPQVKCILKR